MTLHYLDTPHGTRLGYHKTEGTLPGVVFLGGFMSNMQGAKALALEQYCRKRGRAFLRFDYSGHGESSGRFEDGAIGDWKADALFALDTLTQGKQTLVGSSMGGWIALLLALARPEKVEALVGIASAPDFTETLIWQPATEAQKKDLLKNGVYYAPSCYGEPPYPITLRLIEEGRSHLLLTSAEKPIAVTCPVRLIHGMQDTDVPWQLSVQLAARLASAEVEVTLVKSGNHRMSEPENLTLIERMLEF